MKYCRKLMVIKETARRFKENDQVVVTATEMDRILQHTEKQCRLKG